jgi:hypothetical protein
MRECMAKGAFSSDDVYPSPADTAVACSFCVDTGIVSMLESALALFRIKTREHFSAPARTGD